MTVPHFTVLYARASDCLVRRAQEFVDLSEGASQRIDAGVWDLESEDAVTIATESPA